MGKEVSGIKINPKYSVQPKRYQKLLHYTKYEYSFFNYKENRISIKVKFNLTQFIYIKKITL